MVRRGVSRATWRIYKARFCSAGITFATPFDTAGATWRACTNGAFMGWWLYDVLTDGRRVSMNLLQRLQRQNFSEHPFCPATGTGYEGHHDATLEELLQWAQVLRQRFSVEGTPRTVRR